MSSFSTKLHSFVLVNNRWHAKFFLYKSIFKVDLVLNLFRLSALVGFILCTAGCHPATAQKNGTNENTGRATDIAIDATAAQTGVKRLGINIPSQNYYDSGQMLRNLVFRNSGFEGEMWQSILRCKAVTAMSCTDGNQWGQWPANFLDGATFEFITGAAAGESGTVTRSLPAQWQVSNQGTTILFAALAKQPAIDDFVVVRKTFPGNAQAGWWTNTSGGAVLSTEFTDLSPKTQGKQALRIEALSGRSGEVASYFDTSEGRSFVRLHGAYHLSFRAKGAGGNNELHVNLLRQSKRAVNFLSKDVKLSDKWNDYSYDFTANESESDFGSVALKFGVSGGSVLLDDVSLTSSNDPVTNPTAFRDEVVSTLVALHPGVLRYYDDANTGSSIDNIIAPPFARVRAGSSGRGSLMEDLAIGLHEFLQLCQVVGAEPYYNMPPGMTTTEARNLIEYLGGAPSTSYGAKRAARGQVAPWTTVFPVIHLELGNEQWNGSTFPGATINDGPSYGRRAKDIFTAAKSSPAYQADKFDLVMGAQAVNTWLTGRELENSDNYDSIAVAPYLFNRFDDASSIEAIFGPMFAQPEMLDSVPTGYMVQQAKAVKDAKRPAKLVVYEVNLQTLGGSVDQAAFDNAIPSIGAGLAAVDHMLLMLRDLGIKTQSIWALTGYSNLFKNSSTGKDQITPLFSTVVDMGGATNLRRPQFLAEQLANLAILPTMLTTKISGANPTWHQGKSRNDDIQIDRAHTIQSFAFSDGGQRSLIVFNLSRTETLPVTFSGSNAPTGTVESSQLTSKNITDTNETKATVAITGKTLTGFNPTSPYQLPPFSMTVLRWSASH
jgi:alpha-L-arabinofuranosidase